MANLTKVLICFYDNVAIGPLTKWGLGQTAPVAPLSVALEKGAFICHKT